MIYIYIYCIYVLCGHAWGLCIRPSCLIVFARAHSLCIPYCLSPIDYSLDLLTLAPNSWCE